MSQVISIGYGKVNFEHNSASLSCFHLEAPFIRALPSKPDSGMTQRGKVQMFPATDYPEINGKLFTDTLNAPDGKVLMLQSDHRMHGAPTKDAALFLRTRAEGAMYTVTAAIPPYRASLVGDSFLVFQGRGDFLTAEELEDEGFVFTRSWKESFLDPGEIERCFELRELAPQLSDKPRTQSITNLSGETVAVVAARPGRRIRVR